MRDVNVPIPPPGRFRHGEKASLLIITVISRGISSCEQFHFFSSTAAARLILPVIAALPFIDEGSCGWLRKCQPSTAVKCFQTTRLQTRPSTKTFNQVTFCLPQSPPAPALCIAAAVNVINTCRFAFLQGYFCSTEHSFKHEEFQNRQA